METSLQSNVTEVLLGNYESLPKFPTGQAKAQNIPDPEQQNARPSVPTRDGRQTCWSKAVASVSPWPYELLSLILSILAFLAIIVFLRVYDGKTLEQWGLPISLNAVISILSAVFKGSLALPISEGISQLKWIWFSSQSRSLADMEVYDRASRGPWGSFLLIAHQFTRGKRSYLASFGALILLIALAVDPFAQATVGYRSCLIRSSRPAAIPRATTYNAFGAHISAGEESLDGPMQVAIYLGLLTPPANSSASVVTNCPTGNCTFPSDQGATFSTLSMCHSCLDLTNTVVANDPPFRNFSLPGGLSLAGGNLLTTSIAEVFGDQTTLMTFEGLTMKYIDPSCRSVYSCEMEPLAFSCSLTPCLKTYAANFTDSAYHEKELSSENLRFNPSTTRDFSLAFNRTLQSGTWKDCNPTDQQTKTNSVEVFVGTNTVTGGPTYQNINGTATMWYPPECVYIFGHLATEALVGFLPDFFNGKNVSGPPEVGPIWLETLWNNGTVDLGSVSAFVEGLATSMGGQIRKNPAKEWDEKFVLGQAWDVGTCIAVQWPFLSFLALLLALELGFFVAVMVVNQMSLWNGDWKSSTLALLFHGFGGTGDANKEGMSLSSAAMMLDAARQIKTRLEDCDGSWRLSEDI